MGEKNINIHMNYILAILTVIFALIRFQIPSHALSATGSYEAFAHLFVGGLIGAALATRKWNYFWFALALTIVEVVAFFMKHVQ